MLPIKKAIIIAGGEGTRLRPLTYKIPKALIPVHGRTLTEMIFDIVSFVVYSKNITQLTELPIPIRSHHYSQR